MPAGWSDWGKWVPVGRMELIIIPRYRAEGELTISAGVTRTFYYEKGIDNIYEFVPSLKTLSIFTASFSVNRNVLIYVEILEEKEEDPGVYNVIARKYGYQKVKFEFGEIRYFPSNTRPVYRVYNPNDVDLELRWFVTGYIS